jgi:nicotinamidase-related amidase
MPVTMLDPRSALIIIDLQKGLRGLLPDSVFDSVIERSLTLADAFRARKMPVVLVTADGIAPGRTEQPSRMGALPSGFADVVDELNTQPDDLRVMKRSWGAFASTDLEHRLKALDVTQVVITGVSTSHGVESTARQAYEAGFNVTLPVDAMADPRAEMHEHSVTWVFPRLGETGTTQDVLTLLGTVPSDGA